MASNVLVNIFHLKTNCIWRMHSFIHFEDETDKHQINSMKSKSVNNIAFKCTKSEFYVGLFKSKPIEGISFKSFCNWFSFVSLSFPVNIKLARKRNVQRAFYYISKDPCFEFLI